MMQRLHLHDMYMTAIHKPVTNNKPKASSQPRGQCIPAGYSHVHMPTYVSGVNYYLNSIHTKYLAQTLQLIFCFAVFPPQIRDLCGSTYQWNYETFSAL